MNGMETSWKAALVVALLTPIAAAQADEPKAPPQKIRGIAIDENGKPIAGAAIGFVKRTSLLNAKELLKSAKHRTDENGAFEVDRPDTGYGLNLVVAAKGRQACASNVRYQQPAPPELDLGEFVLPRGASLVGRLRDAEGEPIAGAEIRVASAVTQAAVVSAYSRFVLSGGVSNERGIFQVPCVPRTGLQLTVAKKGYLPVTMLVSHESPLAITLQPAGVITGTLVDGTGKPIADARVSVKQEAAPRNHFESTRTAEDGTYTLSAPPAPTRYRIYASAGKPTRQFESKILRGGQTDPEVKEASFRSDSRASLTVHAVDKATGKRVPKFFASTTGFSLDTLQTTLFHADNSLKEYEDEAKLRLSHNQVRGVIVLAAGYAVVATEIPEDLEGPMVVELEKGSVLKGRVVDENGKPVAGVAVRALPDGRASGSGGSIGKHWPRTDKDGNYRIDCLQEGKHQVQVYPKDRTASAPKTIEVKRAEETTLELTIDSAKPLTLNITGELPPGPSPVISDSGMNTGGNKGFQHHIPTPPPITMRRDAQSYEFGLQRGNNITLLVHLPSRTRVGTGSTFPLSRLTPNDGKVDVELPDLACSILRGRVQVDTQLPTARIAVMATPTQRKDVRMWHRQRNVLAGLFADGSFQMDLPDGEYVLQLVDVETGIVFHTESEDHKADTENLVIRPELHWLELDLQAEEEGQPIVVAHFNVELERPRNGIAFMDGYDSRGRASQSVNPRSHPMQKRWLVPAGTVRVTAQQAPDRLRTGGTSYRYSEVANASVEVNKLEQTLKMRIPSPPSDEELEKPKDDQ